MSSLFVKDGVTLVSGLVTVVASAGPHTPLDSMTYINTGASDKVLFTLPDGVELNRQTSYVVDAASGIRITAPTGHRISLPGGGITDPGGFIESTQSGSAVTLLKVAADLWAALAWGGVWQVDNSDDPRVSAFGRTGDRRVVIDASAMDGGSSPPTTLRAGLVLGMLTATKKYKEYDPCGSGGTSTARAILVESTDVSGGEALARVAFRGDFKVSALIGLDAGAKADLDQCLWFEDSEL
jgi:hypothetical protein